MLLLFVYRYDSTTGTFTVPPGGDGVYYLSVYLVTPGGEVAYFEIEVNGQALCSAMADLNASPSGDEAETACHGVADIAEGGRMSFF